MSIGKNTVNSVEENRQELLKICVDSLNVFERFYSFIQLLERKLPLLKEDKQEMSTLIQEYNTVKHSLKDLKEELSEFDTLDEEEKIMSFMLANHDIGLANKFILEFQLRLMNTDIGKEIVKANAEV